MVKTAGKVQAPFKPENAELLKQIQQDIDKEWEALQRLASL